MTSSELQAEARKLREAGDFAIYIPENRADLIAECVRTQRPFLLVGKIPTLDDAVSAMIKDGTLRKDPKP